MRAEADGSAPLPGLLARIRPPNGCALSSHELGGYLRSLSLTPGSNSPFEGTVTPEANPDSGPEPDVAEAIRRLARPELMVEVRGQEAEDSAGKLFGMSSAETFVFHRREKGGEHRIAWPIAREQIVAELERPLDLSSVKRQTMHQYRGGFVEVYLTPFDLVRDQKVLQGFLLFFVDLEHVGPGSWP